MKFISLFFVFLVLVFIAPGSVFASTPKTIHGASVAIPKALIQKKPAKKKIPPKHIVRRKTHKAFLMVNAPLIDPHNPPSSPKP